jgi:hypothetical protein
MEARVPMETPRRKPRWRRRLVTLFVIAIALFIYSRQFHPEREDVAGQRAMLANRDKADRPWRIDALSVLGDLKTLSSPQMEGRAIGTPGGKRARDYVAGRFAQIGLQPAFGRSFEQPFEFVPGRGIRFWRAQFWQERKPLHGVNLAGVVRGSVDAGSYLVVSAHYDHLGIRDGKLYPGADDNASGVATMLAAAQWFRAHPPRHSIMFVAFDGEEQGLRGAHAFVDKPPMPLSSVLVSVNLDMVSRSSVGELFLAGLYANPQLKPLFDPVRATAVPTILYGHDYPRPFWDMDDWTQESDQGPFADHDLAFIYLGVADHADYHKPTDTYERVDQKFFLGVTDTVIDLISAIDAADGAQLRRKRG